MPGFEELRNCGNCIIKVIEIERHLNEYRSGGEGLSNNINRGVVKGGGKAQTSVLDNRAFWTGRSAPPGYVSLLFVEGGTCIDSTQPHYKSIDTPSSYLLYSECRSDPSL